MYCEDKYYIKHENGYNKIHMGDPDLRCNGEIPTPGIRGSLWLGPFNTVEEAEAAVNHQRVHHCRGCFSPQNTRISVNAVSTPMGGQPEYRLKRKPRG